ncbi:maleylpyruvate isomerase N-terminal domain-containing protein [Streptomyces sp. WAC05950]|uniref:maleylpyruvate isomerase N-terminal domain-containing protein n=1 Tax=Streptomyces sp. WAC05950 TaxID=2487419 RepID=UPI0037DD5E86
MPSCPEWTFFDLVQHLVRAGAGGPQSSPRDWYTESSERECWTWWSAGLSPPNAWGLARRRVHEVLVHIYDAQLAAGTVQPMPAYVALDGVAEFLDTCNSTPAACLHEAVTIHYRGTEGCSWLRALDGTGAWHPSRTTPRPPPLRPTGVPFTLEADRNSPYRRAESPGRARSKALYRRHPPR